MSIEVRHLNKRFGATIVCDDLNLDTPVGELVALLGSSGSGKTTLLRIIAGLEVDDSGSVHFHGEDAAAASMRERRVGFVFQHYALFGHMTVFENVAFGLRVRPRFDRFYQSRTTVAPATAEGGRRPRPGDRHTDRRAARRRCRRRKYARARHARRSGAARGGKLTSALAGRESPRASIRGAR